MTERRCRLGGILARLRGRRLDVSARDGDQNPSEYGDDGMIVMV